MLNTKETNLGVVFNTINTENAGQRIDNYLLTKLKGVPKSMIYRIIRKGEVRVNKKRIKPDYKLQENDVLRIPPVNIPSQPQLAISPQLNKIAQIEKNIIFEDDSILVINKPSKLAVHGGSGLNFGLIEALRIIRVEAHHSRFLELVHRLDRETSGLLLVAKKRSALINLHAQLREKTVRKEYVALVDGKWPAECKTINAPLLKNTLASGERIVKVSEQGKPSKTHFKVEKRYKNATLIRVTPITGRTHQIRVHTQYVGHSIALDDKYGSQDFNQQMSEKGLTRLFLHAIAIQFKHPVTNENMSLSAPLDNHLQSILEKLEHNYD